MEENAGAPSSRGSPQHRFVIRNHKMRTATNKLNEIKPLNNNKTGHIKINLIYLGTYSEIQDSSFGPQQAPQQMAEIKYEMK